MYTDGPVPLPGQDFTVPSVLATDGDPLVVPSIPPGSLLAFPLPEKKVPAEILIRVHPTDGEPESLEIIRVPALTTGKARKGRERVAFEVPALPKGIYDAWYVGKARGGSADGRLLPRAAADAAQWTSFEIRPQLSPRESVVHAKPGTIVEVAVTFYGAQAPSHPVEVSLSGFGDGVTLARGQSKTAVTDSNGVAHFEVRATREADVYLAATAEGFEPVAVRVVAGERETFRDYRLQRGDVLLCQGSALISAAIQVSERMQLGSPNPRGRPWYSHAAVYLGDGKVAEMLERGLKIRELGISVEECTTVDVYRRPGVSQKERASIVDYERYGRVPYAWGQIASLGSFAIIANSDRVRLRGSGGFWAKLVAGIKAAAAAVVGWATRTVVTFVVGGDEGRQAMICSEFAAWSYHDANTGLDVSPWWPVVENAGYAEGLDSQMDFTTPNMLAQSEDLMFQFQLYPEVPPEVQLTNCSVQLGEKITFESNSDEVGTDDEDLLEAVVAVLVEHPEIRLQIEGHTDDVGKDAYNLDLSERRADAVEQWLVVHGVASDRLSSRGLGEARPLVSNEDAAGRDRNRRVEFNVDDPRCSNAGDSESD